MMFEPAQRRGGVGQRDPQLHPAAARTWSRRLLGMADAAPAVIRFSSPGRTTA